MSVPESGSRDRKRPDVGAIVAYTVVLVLLMGLAVGISLVWGFWRELTNIDVSTWPPPRIFQQVFGPPIPTGVSEIRAAGRSLISGRTVWLRFRASDKAIASLVSGSERAATQEDAQACVKSTWIHFPRDKTNPERIRWVGRVRWHEVNEIPKPECYQIRTPSTDTMIVVDRNHHLVYVFQYGI
jgi:hypothetical protein